MINGNTDLFFHIYYMTLLLQGWQGGLIRLKKAGLNRMDKTGFFQTIFEKIRFEDNSKNFAEISSAL